MKCGENKTPQSIVFSQNDKGADILKTIFVGYAIAAALIRARARCGGCKTKRMVVARQLRRVCAGARARNRKKLFLMCWNFCRTLTPQFRRRTHECIVFGAAKRLIKHFLQVRAFSSPNGVATTQRASTKNDDFKRCQHPPSHASRVHHVVHRALRPLTRGARVALKDPHRAQRVSRPAVPSPASAGDVSARDVIHTVNRRTQRRPPSPVGLQNTPFAEITRVTLR